jgi:hypothetical protein
MVVRALSFIVLLKFYFRQIMELYSYRKRLLKKVSAALLILLIMIGCSSDPDIKIINVDKGWAANSINTVIFRRNSVVSFNQNQYTAFYDSAGYVALAKRKLNSTDWEIRRTGFTGNIKDAHNSISIMVDGDGYLHMAWDEHNTKLHYCKSLQPESLELTDEQQMLGVNEQSVSYPEFHKLKDGNLIFVYRNGESGNGNMVMNYYSTKEKNWRNLHNNLIDGEEKRNAYWQLSVDLKGVIHLSWVWRETWDVETNHDICYAKSNDGGVNWLKSNNEKYNLPVTMESAEYAAKIPQKSGLINQTSICADINGHPFIANYWIPKGILIPQYHIIYNNGKDWQIKQISELKTPFSLSGGGTKQIPISRPLILCDKEGVLYLVYRSIETGNKVSMSVCNNIKDNSWQTENLTSFSVGMWEPTYDTELWRTSRKLNLFVQNVGQGDSETLESIPPQVVSILEIELNNYHDE